MALNGSGTYVAPASSWNPAVTTTTINSTEWAALLADLTTALSTAMYKDGQSTPTANIGMGGFKLTNLAAGNLVSDAARVSQIQNSSFTSLTSVAGTNTITGTATPTPAAYVVGQVFRGIAANTNTGATTLNISSLGAGAVQVAGVALAGGEIQANAPFSVIVSAVTPVFQLIANGIVPFTTGDVKLTFKTAADAGWVLMNDGTIGNAASSGTTRANADTVGLFTLLWTNTVDADCAVSTGRGGSAAADYAANKTIALPKALGRALASFGAGSGLTSRALAHVVGEESHALTAAENGAHTHGLNGGSGGVPAFTGGAFTDQGVGGSAVRLSATDSSGSGTAHNTMQPTVFLNVMIKL
jgi:hypothetical protein